MHVAARPIAAAHDESKMPYFVVWGVLLVLTAVEVVLAYEQVFTPLHMLEVLMALSLVKSALIIGYFMHLKFEIARMKWIMMVALVACLTLMFIFFADAYRIVNLGVR
ncbi:MAG TPA: cytochrome C oxidase subunit IV family protein [Terriglobales bacterium]|nr:cytochrome C oxidase subunit IV family protein [Terriglobales bacterium]